MNGPRLGVWKNCMSRPTEASSGCVRVRRPIGEAWQAWRRFHWTERDLDARLARGRRAVVPHRLAVADVVAVAVAEVDPPAAGALDRAAAPAHRVGLVQEDDPL